MTESDRVFELRQYTLHRDRRDDLVTLFERELVETQEAAGMRVIATFRDLDRPDRFVWVRGFTDMAARADALATFYDGPVWREHRNAANATMVDSDDVLLMRATDPEHGFPQPRDDRPPVGAPETRPERVAAAVYLARPGDRTLIDWLTREVHPLLEQILDARVVSLRTETADNTFPRLPVRVGANASVWLAAFADDECCSRALTRLAADPRWQGGVEPRLAGGLVGRQSLRLQPTARSAYPAVSG